MAEDSRDAAPTSRMFLYRFFTNICGKKWSILPDLKFTYMIFTFSDFI